MKKYRYLWAVIYSLILVSFTVYVALDTFVITRVYDVVEPPAATTTVTTAPPVTTTPESTTGVTTGISSTTTATTTAPEEIFSDSDEPIITENSYLDRNISVEIKTYREYETEIYVADVIIRNPEFLKTAFAKNSYGKNIISYTSTIARQNNAIFAVSGDYYGIRTKGYVIRNGVLYREDILKGNEDLVIWKDGSIDVINEDDISARELYDNGAQQVITFGPGLIIDGEISVTTEDEVGKAKASNPRSAMGIIDELHYVFVVSDGRTEESKGLSLFQLAEFMEDLGATTAYNLDGGGTATMYFNGNVINKPTSNGKEIKERGVSDIVYIGY